jgi:hypothetical protein
MSQLNQTLGASFDGPDLFASRPSRLLVCAALGVGAVIGAAWIRSRRLEFADVLHAGIGKSVLAWQALFETSLWLTLATSIAAAGVGIAVVRLAPAIAWEAAIPAARTLTAGAIGAILGVATSVALTREKHLFRYFKNR